MHPILFEIPIFGGLPIYTYGVLVALAFLVGIGWAAREGRMVGISKERIYDIAFWAVIAALIGSRILYILTQWRRYAANPISIFKIWEGGLVFYGGLIAAVIVGCLYARKLGIGWRLAGDFFMPGLALGHAIGRLGCFAAGCCFGREFHGVWAITFPPHPRSLAPAGIPLYPAQLVESATALVIFFGLLFVRRRKKFEGQVFFTYLILYSLARIFLETLRGAEARAFLFDHVSVSQGISAAIALTFVGLLCAKRWRAPTTALLLGLFSLVGCSKAVVHGRERPMVPVMSTYAANFENTFTAAKKALGLMGYEIVKEDPEGRLETEWQGTKAGSHYTELFDRKDPGTVGAYYKLSILVKAEGDLSSVEISAPVKSLVGHQESTATEERKVLKKIGDLLRKADFDMTNIGTD